MEKNSINIMTNGFDGFLLEEKLDGLTKLESKNISLTCIDTGINGFMVDILPEVANKKELVNIKNYSKKHRLNLKGLAGHCDISNDADLEKLKKRIRFVNFMGGKFIDTNAGPIGQEADFQKNIKDVIDFAERMDVIVCLETHGDILGKSKGFRKLFRDIDSERIRITYDPANVYFYSRGAIDPIEDLEIALDTGLIYNMHFKGVTHNENKTEWHFPRCEYAIFDYDKVFGLLRRYGYDKNFEIEIEYRLAINKDGSFGINPIWPIDKVIDEYNKEIDYLSKKINWL